MRTAYTIFIHANHTFMNNARIPHARINLGKNEINCSVCNTHPQILTVKLLEFENSVKIQTHERKKPRT